MRAVLLALFAFVTFAGCFGGDAAEAGTGATIRWTEHGIPHITGATFYDAGVGAGWAAAEDNLCMLAEEYVTVMGERSLHFGPGLYRITSNGQTYTNVQSDTFHRIYLGSEHVVSSASWDDERGQGLLDGYVEGYNRYVANVPSDRHEACRDAPWLTPITEQHMEARVNKLQLLASGLFFAPYMVDASPLPGFAPDVPPGIWPTPEQLGLGSNGYAFGRDATGGAGLLLGNPHFSWSGPERFSQLHITVPGEYDVMGAALLGVPLVLIGFNEDLAWTHTVSTAWRFTPYELTLVPGDPMSYIHDGQIHAITTETVTVPVLRGGQVVEEPHSIHFSHLGPIIEFPLDDQVASLPEPLAGELGLVWNPATAYTLHDENARNDRVFEQFFRLGTSHSVADVEAALEDVHGVPWVNTIAADRHGGAFYADISVTPHVTDVAWDDCNTAIGIALTEAARLPVLDGSRAECGPSDGPYPARELPRIQSGGWLLNSNDSHWLPNPNQPLEGYARMLGDERTERSQRTRMGYVLLDERADGRADCTIDPGVACEWMTMGRLQAALFDSRLHAAEVVDDLVAETCALGFAVASDGTLVDLDTPCKVLDAWDRTADLDARGLALFERFWLRAPQTWAEPFDATDPVRTPTDYAGHDPRAINALADAVRDLQRAGIPLDAPVRDVRVSERDGERIGLHGASGLLGSPSMMTFPWSAAGWGEVEHGNSYIQTVTWDADGPVAEALLTYSQSSDPASPFSADQTRMYSAKQWVELPFTEPEIQAALLRERVL